MTWVPETLTQSYQTIKGESAGTAVPFAYSSPTKDRAGEFWGCGENWAEVTTGGNTMANENNKTTNAEMNETFFLTPITMDLSCEIGF
jgi:hypothetical protein